MAADLFGEGGPKAHARRSDPETSHQAAAAVTPGLNALQQRVEAWAMRQPGGFLDIDACEAMPDLGGSTVRTRRAELAQRNIILDSGKRQKPEGASTPHTVWVHRQFVKDAPPIMEPVDGPSSADRDAARAAAARLDGWARSLKAEGRSMLADGLAEAAEIMRKLAR